jgi:hypothetical protein
MERAKMFLIPLVVCLLFGCARIDYEKVPTPTHYDNWTDEDQRKSDSMKGVRYYLPRPFLHLKQSIPVSQRVAFVTFQFNEKEGCYILEMPQNPPTWLLGVAPRRISIGQALAATIAKTRRETVGEQQEGEVVGEEEEKREPPSESIEETPPSELKAQTGFISQTDPVTRLSDKMDVVYLPDFEEQYVIQPRIGLGKAEIETRLRNGWAAEVFSQDLDNSQVIPFVIRQVERASEAAAGIVTDWMPLAAGLPPGTSPATLLELAGIKPGEAVAKMQAGEVEEEPAGKIIAKELLGEVLLFKVAEVRIAQPGIYPILKPREIRQWLKYSGVIAAGDSQANFEEFLKQAQVPWIRSDMAFIPCPPFTMVGFNVTIDVFLAPATDRSMLAANADEMAEDQESLEQIKDSIKTALFNKRNDISADASFINKQSISVEKNASGNGTILTITAPPSKKFTSNVGALTNWISRVFSPEGTGPLPKEEIKAQFSDSNRTVRIEIPVSMDDLAERAKKVK